MFPPLRGRVVKPPMPEAGRLVGRVALLDADGEPAAVRRPRQSASASGLSPEREVLEADVASDCEGATDIPVQCSKLLTTGPLPLLPPALLNPEGRVRGRWRRRRTALESAICQRTHRPLCAFGALRAKLLRFRPEAADTPAIHLPPYGSNSNQIAIRIGALLAGLLLAGIERVPAPVRQRRLVGESQFRSPTFGGARRQAFEPPQ